MQTAPKIVSASGFSRAKTRRKITTIVKTSNAKLRMTLKTDAGTILGRKTIACATIVGTARIRPTKMRPFRKLTAYTHISVTSGARQPEHVITRAGFTHVRVQSEVCEQKQK